MIDTLRGWFRSLASAGPTSLDEASLRKAASDGILALGTFGNGGMRVFPRGVTVRVTVPEGRVDTLRSILEHPEFDDMLVADLTNRLVSVGALPARRYVVVVGEEEGVQVTGDTSSVVCVLVVEGGDRDGARLPIENGRASWRAGRGPRHDDETGQPNDFVLTNDALFVSRAAAVFRYDNGLHVDVRGQAAALVVHPAVGTPVFPYNTPRKSCPLHVGDVVVFNDGQQAQIRVRCLPGDAS